LTGNITSIVAGNTAIGSIEGTGQFWKGLIDEVNIFSRALSPEEVKELYVNPPNQNLNQPELPTGAIGEWDLNGDSKDTSGNGNNGVDSNMTYSQGRKDNLAGVFNGTSSKIDLPGGLPASDCSITFQFKSVKDSNSRYLFAQNSGASRRYIVKNTGDAIVFGSRRSNGTTVALSSISSGDWIENQWHSLVAIQAGLVTSIYLDGILIDTDTHADIYTSFLSTGYLGANTSANYFDGDLENVKVFDYALTEQEILALAEKTQPVKDNSGNGNDGYSVNPVSWVQGIAGKAAQINDGYIKLPGIDTGKDFSISLWNDCAKDSILSNLTIATEEAGNIYLTATLDSVDFRYYTADGVYTGLTLSTLSETWHTILITVEDGEFMKLYVDGVLVDSDTTPTLTTLSNDILLGYIGYGSTYKNNLSDEVRFYQRIVTPDESRGLYKNKTSVNSIKREVEPYRVTKILPGVISTGLVEAKEAVIIGYQGYDIGNPIDGDRRIRLILSRWGVLILLVSSIPFFSAVV